MNLVSNIFPSSQAKQIHSQSSTLNHMTVDEALAGDDMKGSKRTLDLPMSVCILSKAAIGIGALSIGQSYHNLGIILASITTALTGILSFLCLHFISRLAFATKKFYYADLCNQVFGRKFEAFYMYTTLIVVIGALIIYCNLIGSHARHVLGVICLIPSGNRPWYARSGSLTVFICSLALPFCFYRQGRPLAATAFLSLLCFFYLFFLIACDLTTKVPARINYLPTSFSESTTAVGFILLAFNNHPLMLKVVRGLGPSSTSEVRRVVLWSNVFITLFYIIAGIGSCLVFADRTKGILKQERYDPVFTTTQFVITLGLALSIPLLVFPACTVIEWVLRRWNICSSTDFANSLGGTESSCSDSLQPSVNSRSRVLMCMAEKGSMNTYLLPLLVIASCILLSLVNKELFTLIFLILSIGGIIITFIFPPAMMLKMQKLVEIKRWEKIGAIVCLTVGSLILGIFLSGEIAHYQLRAANF